MSSAREVQLGAKNTTWSGNGYPNECLNTGAGGLNEGMHLLNRHLFVG